jgi:3-oxoacyl-[acyl-carrier protein] reductase
MNEVEQGGLFNRLYAELLTNALAFHLIKNYSATIQEIEAAKDKAFAVKGNIGSLAGIEALFAKLDTELHKRTSNKAIDILINNAGVIDFATVADSSEEVFDRVFAVNVNQSFFSIQCS